jgi:hypothetical protein
LDGQLFLINRDAKLPASALQVGSSTKDWRSNSTPTGRCAGKHGEGLKAAVAALLRMGLRVEIHQSRGGLVFSVDDDTDDDKPQPIKYMFTDGYTSHRQLDLKDKLACMRLKEDLNVNRSKDVIVVVSGLRNFPDAFKRFFLVRSHMERSAMDTMTEPNHFVRLRTKYGDLLWPSDPKHPDGVQGRVYVAGILWAHTQGPPLYGVDFPSDVSDDRDRRLINNEAYCKRMAKVFNAFLQSSSADDCVASFKSKVVESLLEEIESTKEGIDDNANQRRHLFKLEWYLSERSSALLADAFRTKRRAELDKTNATGTERPIDNFLMPTSGPIQEDLKKWASSSCFYRTSTLLYLILVDNGHFMSEEHLSSLSTQNLLRCPLALEWPSQLLSVLESMWPTLLADRMELRDTGDERCVPYCTWMPDLGKVVVSSSRILNTNVWKVVKAIKEELKEMGKDLKINTAPAKIARPSQAHAPSASAATATGPGVTPPPKAPSAPSAEATTASATTPPPVAKSPLKRSDAAGPPATKKPLQAQANDATTSVSSRSVLASPQACAGAAIASVRTPPAAKARLAHADASAARSVEHTFSPPRHPREPEAAVIPAKRLWPELTLELIWRSRSYH